MAQTPPHDPRLPGTPTSTALKGRDSATADIEERLNLAMEAGQMGAWEWNVETGEVIWSETLERIHGLEPGTFSGTFQSYLSDVHPDDVEHVLNTISHSLESDRHELEYRIVLPDGGVRWLAANGVVIRDKSGKPVKLVGICRDVTDRNVGIRARELYLEQLHTIYEITNAVNRAEDLNQIYDLAVDGIVHSLKVDKASLLLFDDDVLRFKSWAGLSDEYRTATTGHSPWSRDTVDPQPVLVTDVREEPSLAGLLKVIEDEGIRALAFIPMVNRGRLIGEFMMYFATPHAFTENEIQLAETLSGNVAFAIERKRTEDTLREAEGKYRSIFENAVFGISQTTPDGRFISANEALAHILGYDSPEEMLNDISNIGRQLYVSPNDRLRYVKELQETGSVSNFQTALYRKDGQIIWISVSSRAIFDDQGGMQAIEGIIEDITQRKRAEEALQKSEEKYRGIFDTAPVSIWEEDFSGVKALVDQLAFEIDDVRSYLDQHMEVVQEGIRLMRILDVNEETIRMFDANSKDELRTSLETIFLPETLHAFKEEMVAMAEGRRHFSADAPVHTLKGERKETVFTIDFPPPDGDFTRILVARIDVTEQRQAELALREAENRYRNILDTAPVSIWEEDFSDVKRMVDALVLETDDVRSYLDEHPEFVQRAIKLIRILDVNQETVRMFNANNQDELRASLETVFLPETMPAFREELVAMAEGRRHFSADAPVRTLTGERKETVFTIDFPPDGDFTRILVARIDVTDQKVAERALHEVEDRYRNIFENAIFGIFQTTQEGRFISANPALAEILGYDSVDDLVRSVQNIAEDVHVNPDKRREFAAALLEHGSVQGFEAPVYRKDHSIIWIALTARLLKDDQGNVQGFEGIVQDITERRTLEEQTAKLLIEINAEKELLNSLISTTPGMVGENYGHPDDPERPKGFISDYVETLLGYTAEEWTADPNLAWKSLHPDDQERVRQEFAQIERKGKGRIEARLRRKDGSYIWVESHVVAICDETGQTLGFRGVTMDIDERKRLDDQRAEVLKSEQAARAEAEKAARVMANVQRVSDTALTHLTLDELLDELLLRLREILNADTATILLLTEDEQGIAVHAHSGLAEELTDNLYVPMGKGIAGLVAQNRQLMIVNDTIGIELLSVPAAIRDQISSLMAAPLIVEGRLIGVVNIGTTRAHEFTIEDAHLLQLVSDRMALSIQQARLYESETIAREEAEQAQAELQKANEEKDEFLGLVSHELRTPITSIYGGVRVLRSRGDRLDEESRAGVLLDIEHETERLHRLVEDLLVLARLELGQEIEKEPVMIQRTLDKIVASYQSRRPNREITLSVEPTLPPVNAVPLYIEQVMRNLLSNADKYSPINEPIEVKATREGDSVAVTVIDRGVGLDPAETSRIFERFYRSNATAKKAQGIGIGLTVCKRLIDAQSGRIWAEPGEERGLMVSFTLPVYEEETL